MEQPATFPCSLCRATVVLPPSGCPPRPPGYCQECLGEFSRTPFAAIAPSKGATRKTIAGFYADPEMAYTWRDVPF